MWDLFCLHLSSILVDMSRLLDVEKRRQCRRRISFKRFIRFIVFCEFKTVFRFDSHVRIEHCFQKKFKKETNKNEESRKMFLILQNIRKL